jgi:hypothetical protein
MAKRLIKAPMSAGPPPRSSTNSGNNALFVKTTDMTRLYKKPDTNAGVYSFSFSDTVFPMVLDFTLVAVQIHGSRSIQTVNVLIAGMF